MKDINDGTKPFIESEWIQVGKQYPKDPPLPVHWARLDKLSIPQEFESFLPAPSLPITKFLALQYPQQSSGLISTKAQAWFSPDNPTTDIASLMSWPIPLKQFLSILEKSFGQALFDGANSVVDQRFNSGTEHFPLWVITFWQRIADIADKQAVCRRSIKWLDRQGQLRMNSQTQRFTWHRLS